ncbi:bifunctional 4-hydroxy-2-oxoglutarate aldolase/2-dehydro-3-deoxy-phosphogluconate aldolase [[Erwinia] mediterraneensis]|uniref:bifunctional 4-hydroxy-2-oxoglutarate aldolase/2-dehydro-3-deoxy-phosphogluconate aldolase n=1 Tax=[Erwinia] mediterraneensis TaxID=2161819 RepID=UPI001030F514|nr:bifunctional 4-hydroxy-2-oxoglutarate aldolase/2-dehydro-3-deoxy-phosphogluconate aldolase [[Erwinia] mediterraneensis]
MNPIFELIHATGVVPVIAIERARDALPLADALLEGGLPLAEITFRTAAAAEVIATLTRERPELRIGAGTLLNEEAVNQAKESGATFGLAPGFDPRVLDAAVKYGLDFAPGIMTPSELSMAASLGLRVMKFFPAGIAGGPAALSGINAPFSHLGLRFIPTGGITQDTLGDWLRLPQVLAVGGTWIARSEDIRNGNFTEITRLARAACQQVQQIREQA